MSSCHSSGCGGCPSQSGCGSAPKEEEFPKEPMLEGSSVKCVIGVVSGKGGVGKSLTTESLAVLLQRAGLQVGILDADVTGPSIPKAFGKNDAKAQGTQHAILPIVTKTGIKLMSVNVLLEDNKDPVVWRGPIMNNAIRQFWSNVEWGNLDVMLIDMPPGTGEVPLTVFQFLPVHAVVMVTSPQEAVGLIVEKSIRMAEKMDIPLLGVIENFAWFDCENCSKRHYLYGKSHLAEVRPEEDFCRIQVPLRPSYATLVDRGEIEEIEVPECEPLIEMVKTLCNFAM